MICCSSRHRSRRLLAFLCQNHPGSSARCPVSHVQGGSIKTAIQAGSALAFTSAFIDFRGQRIKHDSHKEYAAYNSALMKTIKGATTGLISGTIWVLLLPPGIMFLVLRETLLFQAS
ncbi:hypothetical protein S83_048392 [Arachis hypogaea]